MFHYTLAAFIWDDGGQEIRLVPASFCKGYKKIAASPSQKILAQPLCPIRLRARLVPGLNDHPWGRRAIYARLGLYRIPWVGN
jgi:hypothetical protein